MIMLRESTSMFFSPKLLSDALMSVDDIRSPIESNFARVRSEHSSRNLMLWQILLASAQRSLMNSVIAFFWSSATSSLIISMWRRRISSMNSVYCSEPSSAALALFSSRLVTPCKADTTTTKSCLPYRPTILASCSMRSALATDEPPNFNICIIN